MRTDEKPPKRRMSVWPRLRKSRLVLGVLAVGLQSLYWLIQLYRML
ncbi:hypothetical protein ACFQ6N_32165 [Kitasatospora sp. NPDC056446]